MMRFFLPQPQKLCLEVHPGMCEDYTSLKEGIISSLVPQISGLKNLIARCQEKDAQLL